MNTEEIKQRQKERGALIEMYYDNFGGAPANYKEVFADVKFLLSEIEKLESQVTSLQGALRLANAPDSIVEHGLKLGKPSNAELEWAQSAIQKHQGRKDTSNATESEVV